MSTVGQVAQKVRSKNAGPFWLTIDIFCGSDSAFRQIGNAVSTARVADLFQVAPDTVKRFDIADLHVIKFSMPRPVVQGDIRDRDMHGAGWAPLLSELAVN